MVTCVGRADLGSENQGLASMTGVVLLMNVPKDISRFFPNPDCFFTSKPTAFNPLLTMPAEVKVEKVVFVWLRRAIVVNNLSLHISGFFEGEKPSKYQASTDPSRDW